MNLLVARLNQLMPPVKWDLNIYLNHQNKNPHEMQVSPKSSILIPYKPILLLRQAI
ncbi:Uncharacterised protein [Actinobacillus pleuropneumoniae]|jgi:hypothetical protein|nr:Uncharacterised protein [Actinobacillus pleuropneumoniae]